MLSSTNNEILPRWGILPRIASTFFRPRGSFGMAADIYSQPLHKLDRKFDAESCEYFLARVERATS
jgi:hypothetical protein